MNKLQKIANSIARKHGYGTATEIVRVSDDHPIIIKHVTYGYRKRSTGEYVSNRYRQCFGWKNTYYQNAETIVGIPSSWT